MAHTRLYREGKLALEDFPVEDISEHLKVDGVYVWLDYCRPTQEDLAAIAEELKLHPLAVEDAVNEPQRPKIGSSPRHASSSECNSLSLY